jgi:hypothetical protein
MGFVPFTVSKLASEGGDGCGVWCSPEGVFIGPGIALVERLIDGEGNEFAVVPLDHLNKVLSAGYGKLFDMTRYIPGLARVAVALSKGDFALANIALVQLRLPSFPNSDDGQVAAIIDELLKARWDERWPKGTLPQGDGKAPAGSSRRATGMAMAALPLRATIIRRKNLRPSGRLRLVDDC